MRIGVLGGTFDPPHVAHLIGGEAAHRELGLEAVLFMPAGSPWQKADRDVTAASHRWEMTRLATGGIDYLVADDREVRRPGWTYTIDTLATFDEPVALIVGADTARGLAGWHRAEEVLELARIAVIPRPGVSRAEVDDVIEGHHWLDVPELPVSGTMLRDRARRGSSIRFFVPETVYEYVAANSVYG